MTWSVDLDDQRERAAKSQSLFREVNERIRDLAGSVSSTSFICECATETCDQALPLTREEYERIRADSNSFFVIAGHELPEIEEITESTDRYLVVSKLGVGGAIAERLDPRKRVTR